MATATRRCRPASPRPRRGHGPSVPMAPPSSARQGARRRPVPRPRRVQRARRGRQPTTSSPHRSGPPPGRLGPSTDPGRSTHRARSISDTQPIGLVRAHGPSSRASRRPARRARRPRSPRPRPAGPRPRPRSRWAAAAPPAGPSRVRRPGPVQVRRPGPRRARRPGPRPPPPGGCPPRPRRHTRRSHGRPRRAPRPSGAAPPARRRPRRAPVSRPRASAAGGRRSPRWRSWCSSPWPPGRSAC